MSRKKFNLGPGQYYLESIFESKKSKGNKFSKDIDKRSPNYIEPQRRQLVDNPDPGTYQSGIIQE